MDSNLELLKTTSTNPLMSSLVSAVYSMKEATSEKIFQKVLKEGVNNYSKPQVDRALANALKYGIFEVKNNRYRVRDDVLDDVDTVYWKVQKKHDKTPFRTQEDMLGRNFQQKLDPEKDNLRFRKLTNDDIKECPQCGRSKKPEGCTTQSVKKTKDKNKGKKGIKNDKKLNKIKPARRDEENDDLLPSDFKVKNSKRNSLTRARNQSPKSKISHKMNTNLMNTENKKYCDFDGKESEVSPAMKKEKKHTFSESSEEESISLTSDDDDEQLSFTSSNHRKVNVSNYVTPSAKKIQNEDNQNEHDMEHRNVQDYNYNLEQEDNVQKIGRKEKGRSLSSSFDSLKTESDSEIMPEPKKRKINQTNNKYSGSKRKRHAKMTIGMSQESICERDDAEPCCDYISLTDVQSDPEGTIIQSNNVLKIQPMDSMPLKDSEHASYIA